MNSIMAGCSQQHAGMHTLQRAVGPRQGTCLWWWTATCVSRLTTARHVCFSGLCVYHVTEHLAIRWLSLPIGVSAAPPPPPPRICILISHPGTSMLGRFIYQSFNRKQLANKIRNRTLGSSATMTPPPSLRPCRHIASFAAAVTLHHASPCRRQQRQWPHGLQLSSSSSSRRYTPAAGAAGWCG